MLKRPMQLGEFASPHAWSAIVVSVVSLQLLGSPTCTFKLLKTLFILTLKRLASGVQLPPWPP